MENIEANLVSFFIDNFGNAPEIIIKSPGRVNLIGDHTDYNFGFAMPMAIDRHTFVAIGKRHDGIVCGVSNSFLGQDLKIDIESEIVPHPNAGHWTNYAKGVIQEIKTKYSLKTGFNFAIISNLPQGAGLSSSASFEVGLGLALSKLFGLDISRKDIALIGQAAEHIFAGCQCGIMDQLTIACAQEQRALFMDFQSLEIEEVKIPKEFSLYLVLSGISRGLVDGEYNNRRNDCLNAAKQMGIGSLRNLIQINYSEKAKLLDKHLLRRVKHVFDENNRVKELKRAFGASDIKKVSEILRASHESLANNYEVSTPKMDELIRYCNHILKERGGARMTGGGFGGAAIAIMSEEIGPKFVNDIQSLYRDPVGNAPLIIKVSPNGGAMQIV